MYTDFKKPTMAEIEVNKLSKKFLSEVANTCIGKNIAEDTDSQYVTCKAMLADYFHSHVDIYMRMDEFITRLYNKIMSSLPDLFPELFEIVEEKTEENKTIKKKKAKKKIKINKTYMTNLVRTGGRQMLLTYCK